jgi:hypothetical protein
MKELRVTSPSGKVLFALRQVSGEPAETLPVGLENWRKTGEHWCRTGITVANRELADVRIVAADDEEFLPRVVDYLRAYDPQICCILRELHS